MMRLNKRLLITVLLFGFIFFVSLFAQRNNPSNIGVVLYVSPVQSTVKVNGKATNIDKLNSLSLKPGTYEFEFSYEGFESKKASLKLIEGMATQSISGALKPLSKESESILQKPEEVIARERAEGAELAKPLEDAPMRKLSRLLPEVNRYYRIDYGVSKKFPGDGLAVYIAANEAEYRQWALDWIRARGFDPSDYEFVFSSYEEPL